MSSSFDRVLGMCQLMLAADQPVTNETIASAVEQVCGMAVFAGVDRDELHRVLEERFTVYTRDAQTLGSDDGHEPWLHVKQETIEWRFWDRYRLFLAPNISISAFERGVDKVTTDVLSRLEDPDRSGMWDRRGLVVGHVQAGKTANYIGLINKAADAGYKVIIVLTGVHESLRCQTQARLDEGFLGRKSQPRSAGAQTFVATGVGLIDPSVNANTGTNRFNRGDFSRPVAAQFGITPGGLPLLFAVKKNASVLKNLLSWIRTAATAHDADTNRNFVPSVPVLVIDDESDLASVDTGMQAFDEFGNPDPDHNPKTINRQIRQILRLFEKVAYVGYTATPFANIFIHDQGSTAEHGDDLFPRSFIVNLPPPDNYMGPTRVFGLDNDSDAGLSGIEPLPLIRQLTDHAVSEDGAETRGWMPPRLTAKTEHIPIYGDENRIPPSLREAMLTFILSATVRRLRRLTPIHNSMLVHVVRYTNVQRRVAAQIETELKDIVRRVVYGDGDRSPTILDELRGVWETSEGNFIDTNLECARVAPSSIGDLPPWADVERELVLVAKSIRVKLINGDASDVLDYTDNKDGLNVIAVGGDKLSRGLTLEGLSVSYFLRSSRMYDTLMQMGRWFGYRDGYIDLCRLYTSAELVEWFTHIAAATEELLIEFDRMAAINGTPKDYGLKVRSHPVLLVTSAVKMKHGTQMKLSFNDQVSETIVFDRDEQWLRDNLNATARWVESLGKPQPESKSEYIWTGIGAEYVVAFLKHSGYQTHKDARKADALTLAAYIEAQQGYGELTHWTVKLCSSTLLGAAKREIAGYVVGLFTRTPRPTIQRDDRYTIRQLLNPPDQMADLSVEQKKHALERPRKAWDNMTEEVRQGKKRPGIPNPPHIRAIRDKSAGLLLLYPIDPSTAGSPTISTVVMGLAISFPVSFTAREISYIVDNVFRHDDGNGDDDA